MIQVNSSGDDDCQIRAVPNRSLTDKECVLAFALIAAASLTVVGVLASRGIWMPLPFAGAELALLGLCMKLVQRSGRKVDQIDIDADRVTVRQLAPGRLRQERFQTGWVKVQLRRGQYAAHRTRLTLSSRGRELEVGAFLNEDERGQLATELLDRLRHRSALLAS